MGFPNTQLELAPHLRQQVKLASGRRFPRGSLASCRLFSSCRQLVWIQPSAQPPLRRTQAAALIPHVHDAESRYAAGSPFLVLAQREGAGWGPALSTVDLGG